MKESVILIPAYNPNEKLLTLVRDLINSDFKKIIIVDDGSNKSSDDIFDKLKEFIECDVLSYRTNKGKGYALKYGMMHYLKNLKNDYIGLINVDADYQHLVKDVIKLAKEMKKKPESLILGVRNFDLENVPLRNARGNKITSAIFKSLYGQRIVDTQTGLRAIPNSLIEKCLYIPYNRFEYEMKMLIQFAKDKITIEQIEIETVYYEEKDSHFNPFLDSIKIYRVLLTEYIKFLLSSLICYSIDIILFSVFSYIFSYLDSNIRIIASTIFARLIADFLNYNINKNIVFESRESGHKLFIRYYLLSVGKMFVSALSVAFIHHLLIRLSETVIKMVIDTIIYVISYIIQKKYIFKTK